MDIVQIVKKVPFILKTHFQEELESRVTCYLQLGFTKEDIIEMTSNNPYLFLYSNDSIHEKFNGIQSFGFSIDEVIKMIHHFPLLLGYDINSIQEKIKFYRSIQFDSILVSDSKVFMHNLEFIKMRYSYLSKKIQDFSVKDSSTLFMRDSEFKKKFHITREDLIKEEGTWMF